MQPIVRPAAQYAGPEQDIKLLNRNVCEFERPVDYSPAFSFVGKFKSLQPPLGLELYQLCQGGGLNP